MKKLLCALLICALCACALAGCRRSKPQSGAEVADAASEADFSPDTTPVPEVGEHGEEDQSAALQEMPTVPPLEAVDGDASGDDGGEDYYSMEALLTDPREDEGDAAAPETPEAAQEPDGSEASPPAVSVIDPNSYSFSALTDTTMGFTFNYPSQWVNVPGVYTVCYREVVEAGDFPARVAICGKKLVHTPEDNDLTNELTDFVRTIRKQYDTKTFQLGTPNTQDTFLGKQAISNTYLAFSGETEVKGFIIGVAIGRRLYVFHFCASYEDYTAMESVMRYMLKSVELIEEDK